MTHSPKNGFSLRFRVQEIVDEDGKSTFLEALAPSLADLPEKNNPLAQQEFDQIMLLRAMNFLEENPQLFLSVNVFPATLSCQDFYALLGKIPTALRHQIIFEILETTPPYQILQAMKIRRLGFAMALDDYRGEKPLPPNNAHELFPLFLHHFPQKSWIKIDMQQIGIRDVFREIRTSLDRGSGIILEKIETTQEWEKIYRFLRGKLGKLFSGKFKGKILFQGFFHGAPVFSDVFLSPDKKKTVK